MPNGIDGRVTARLDSTQEMAIESARQAAKAHMVEMAYSEYKAVLNESTISAEMITEMRGADLIVFRIN